MAKSTRKDWIKTISYVILALSVMLISGILLLPRHWIVWALIVIMILISLANWHYKSFAYKCSKCKKEFDVSFVVDLISPYGIDKVGNWKYTLCTRCGQMTKARVIKK